MVINGHFLTEDPYENYLATAWERGGRGYEAPRHTPMVRRWKRPRYAKHQHATQVWTNWFGRIEIAR
jgi:hypothetical protein